MVKPASPLFFLEGLVRNLPPLPKPPQWMSHEALRRVVLLLNHVLMQEPAAMQRLQRLAGQTVLVRWRDWHFPVVFSRAGLLDMGLPNNNAPDLTLTFTQESPLDLLGNVIEGSKPPLRVEGNVQLAAEINWLVDHVRWDIEEDLSRILGDAPAHVVVQWAREAAQSMAKYALGRGVSQESAQR